MRFILLALLCFALVACMSSPTGRNQLILVPESQMESMGAQSFDQMKSKGKLSGNQAYKNYVQCLSNSLLMAAGERPINWEVQVFEDDSPNAFALPGRKIGVHTGMFKVAETPAQLAAVIGHEIGHVQARHGAERVSLNLASQLGQQLAAIGLQDNEYAGLIMGALGVGAQVGVLLPYSRTHESEADFMGLVIMARAGYDPRESIKLWENMAKVGGGKPPEFLSTHPSGNTRISQLNEHMEGSLTIYKTRLQAGSLPLCKKP